MKFLAILLAIGVLMGASSAKAEGGFDLLVVDAGEYYTGDEYADGFDDIEFDLDWTLGAADSYE